MHYQINPAKIETHYDINEALISLAKIQINQFSRQGKLINKQVYKRISMYAVRRLMMLESVALDITHPILRTHMGLS